MTLRCFPSSLFTRTFLTVENTVPQEMFLFLKIWVAHSEFREFVLGWLKCISFPYFVVTSSKLMSKSESLKSTRRKTEPHQMQKKTSSKTWVEARFLKSDIWQKFFLKSLRHVRCQSNSKFSCLKSPLFLLVSKLERVFTLGVRTFLKACFYCNVLTFMFSCKKPCDHKILERSRNVHSCVKLTHR